MNGTLRIRFVGITREDEVLGGGESAVLGRAADARVRLDAPQVSSRHACIMGVGDRWLLVDQGSRNGTLLNGVLIPPQTAQELVHGDVITLNPFRLAIDFGKKMQAKATTLAMEDSSVVVRAIEAEELESLAGRRLQLLIDSATAMQAAQTLQQLCDASVIALLAGTGFSRALVLRTDAGGGIEVHAQRQQHPHADAPRVSRSLLKAAAQGHAVCLENSNLNMAESIVGSGVTAALCIPVIVGELVEGFVYLDSIGGARPGEDAAAFAQALSRFLAMGIGELQRRDLSERKRLLEEELAGAHGVQQRLMPQERGEMDGWRWRLHSEPGQFVAGDIIGAGQSPAGPWLFLGDVAGKGAAAGMLMAVIQAHLSCDLQRGLPLRECVNQLNAFIMKHRGGTEFATLMVIRFTVDGSRIEIVDAGHGLAVMQRHGGGATLVQAEGGPPIGVVDQLYESTHIDLAPGDRLIIFSDGVNEQRGPDGHELGLDRVVHSFQSDHDVELDVESLVALLRAHAAGLPLTDDVSLISVVFAGNSDSTRHV